MRVDPDGSVHVEADDLWFPNGTVIDGDTLIVAETFAGRLTAFTIAADGTLDRPPRLGRRSRRPSSPARSRRCSRSWASPPTAAAWTPRATSGRPTGSAGRPAGSRPAARSSSEIALPEGLGAFACMLGGEDGRTLLLCSAPDFIEANRKDVREAVLLTTTVDVPHGGRP